MNIHENIRVNNIALFYLNYSNCLTDRPPTDQQTETPVADA